MRCRCAGPSNRWTRRRGRLPSPTAARAGAERERRGRCATSRLPKENVSARQERRNLRRQRVERRALAAAGRRGCAGKSSRADLLPGTMVHLFLSADQKTVDAVIAEEPTAHGVIKAVDVKKNTLTVTVGGGGARDRGGEPAANAGSDLHARCGCGDRHRRRPGTPLLHPRRQNRRARRRGAGVAAALARQEDRVERHGGRGGWCTASSRRSTRPSGSLTLTVRAGARRRCRR